MLVLAGVVLLAGCGGGGGGGDDPLALLEGTWFGPAHQGATTLVIDASGLTYGSPPATMLAAFPDSFRGPFGDSAHATTGFIEIFASPDLNFLAAAAFPFTNTQTANAAFHGAWTRQ